MRSKPTGVDSDSFSYQRDEPSKINTTKVREKGYEERMLTREYR